MIQLIKTCQNDSQHLEHPQHGHSLVNTHAVPKLEIPRGSSGWLLSVVFTMWPHLLHILSWLIQVWWACSKVLWKIISLEQGDQNSPTYRVSKTNILVLCTVHGHPWKAFHDWMQAVFGTNSISCSDSTQKGQHLLMEGAKLLHAHTRVKTVLPLTARPDS